MPIFLRLLLLLLAGASILGARYATRQADAQFSWPATSAMRQAMPTGQAPIAELSSPRQARRAL